MAPSYQAKRGQEHRPPRLSHSSDHVQLGMKGVGWGEKGAIFSLFPQSDLAVAPLFVVLFC